MYFKLSAIRLYRHGQLWAFFSTVVFLVGGNGENRAWAQGRHDVMSITGQSAPDGNGTLSLFDMNPGDDAVINLDGTSAFKGYLTGTSGAFTNIGIFRGNGGTLSQIARGGEPSPDGNGFFISFSSPIIKNSGAVVFRGLLEGTSGGFNVDTRGVFMGSGGNIVQIVRQAQPAPDGNGFFDFISSTISNNSERVAFMATLSQTSGGFDDNVGLFIGDGTMINQLVRSGDVAPDGNGLFDSIAISPRMNAADNVAFKAFMRETTGNESEGIFLATDNDILQVARTGDAAPDGNGVFDVFEQLELNDFGLVAFATDLIFTSGGGVDDKGIFRGDGTDLIQIARAGQNAPDGNGVFDNVFSIEINNSGEVSFSGILTGTSGGSTDDRGVFRSDGSAITQILREGQPAADGNGTITFFTQSHLIESGAVATNCYLTGTSGGTSDDVSLNIADEFDFIQVARKGQLVSGSPIVELVETMTNSFNSHGQVTYIAKLADGRQTVRRFTPDLHWRTGSGDWDSSDSWTLGITPSHVHDVFIDPDSDETVLGPLSDLEVRKLTVGGGAGAATLILQGSEFTAQEVQVDFGSALSGEGQVNAILDVQGNLVPGQDSLGTISVNGSLKLRVGSKLTLEIEDSNPGQFDHLQVNGALIIAGDLSVDLNNFLAQPCQQVTVIEVDGVTKGEFSGLPEGALVANLPEHDLFITYQGGDGNDVVLYTSLLGDVNLSGNIDLLDVGPFVNALVQGVYRCEADLNQDGDVNLLDVQRFVELLASG